MIRWSNWKESAYFPQCSGMPSLRSQPWGRPGRIGCIKGQHSGGRELAYSRHRERRLRGLDHSQHRRVVEDEVSAKVWPNIGGPWRPSMVRSLGLSQVQGEFPGVVGFVCLFFICF